MGLKVRQVARLWRQQKGFTLVEILLVLTITVVLASLVWKVSYEKLEQARVEQFVTTLQFRIKEMQNYAMEHYRDVVVTTHHNSRRLEIELSLIEENSVSYVPWWTWELPPYISRVSFKIGDLSRSKIIFSPTGQMNAIYSVEVEGEGKRHKFVMNLQRGRMTNH